MKKLSESEMKNVLGGLIIRDCRDALQHEAYEFNRKEHTASEVEKFYDSWNRRWEDCLRSLGIAI